MSEVSRETLALISRIYDGAMASGQWTDILEEISIHLNGLGSAIYYEDAQHSELDMGISTGSHFWQNGNIDKYVAGPASEEPVARLLRYVKPHEIITSESIPFKEKIRIAPFAMKMWKTFGIRALAAAQLDATGAWFNCITVQYDGKHGPMQSDENRRLATLIPHIAKSLEISRPMVLLKQRFNAVLESLDHFHVGVLILDKSFTVVISNVTAQAILEQNDGIRLNVQGIPEVAREPEQAQLLAALKQVMETSKGQSKAEGRLMSIPRRSGKDAFLLEVAPLTDSGQELTPDFQGAILFMIDPVESGKVSTAGMSKIYGLTVTESVICELLVKGHSNREMADIRNVSPETVKTQVQSTMKKTGVANRSSLVRLALSINLPIDKADN